MRRVGDNFELVASDLIGHLNCRHLTKLDVAVARGELKKPEIWDPSLELLRERGARHEAAYIDHLKETGHTVTLIEGQGIDRSAFEATRAAMRDGADIIAQAALAGGQWAGRADVLRRVPEPSGLGSWSYEVVDTKLARETKGGTVLQLCLYSELVGNLQRRVPDYAYIVAPFTNFVPEQFRIGDYAAYHRLVQNGLIRAIRITEATYPEPIAHCEICRWREACDDRRHADDHLSLVAGISKTQAAELARRGIDRMARLAEVELPLEWKPERGSITSYTRVCNQARIQIKRTCCWENHLRAH